jgi:hypothetical protein
MCWRRGTDGTVIRPAEDGFEAVQAMGGWGRSGLLAVVVGLLDPGDELPDLVGVGSASGSVGGEVSESGASVGKRVGVPADGGEVGGNIPAGSPGAVPVADHLEIVDRFLVVGGGGVDLPGVAADETELMVDNGPCTDFVGG